MINEKRNILYSLDQLPNNCKIALYGSGKIGLGFKSLINKNRGDILVTCYINTFTRGKQDNLEIIKLDDLDENTKLFDMIIICSSLWNQIEDELVKRSFKFCIISNELLYETLDISALGSFRFEVEERDKISVRLNKILSLFDNENKKYFKLLMDLRLSDNEYEIFKFFKLTNKIFKTSYLDYIDSNIGTVILEGGVSDGNDSVNFYNFFDDINLKIYGFEPFIKSFDISRNKSVLIEKGMEIFPWALWDKNQPLYFNKNEFSSSTSSVIRKDDLMDDNSIVKGVTIDSFVVEHSIDSIALIKLDIEGAEMEALRGSKETITNFKPQLAISIYHKKEHLFEIPEILKEYNPDYKFKLGFYSPTFIDTVLYAIP